jgi:hypothetical protein
MRSSLCVFPSAGTPSVLEMKAWASSTTRKSRRTDKALLTGSQCWTKGRRGETEKARAFERNIW